MNGLGRKLSGSPDHPAVLFLHGFLGTSADWRDVVAAIEDRTFCIALDLPGHGASLGLTAEAYTMEGAARAVVCTLDELGVGRPVIAGYSMGGRLALYLALRYPERCAGLFLESASPGLAGEEERTARRRSDEDRAKRLESEDFEAFLGNWYRQPLFAPLARDERLLWQTIEARRRNDPVELARSLRGMGTGRQPSLWGELEGLALPTLAVTGGLDTKYAEISSRMAGTSPRVETVVVPGVGHNVHEEAPAEYVDLLGGFLDRLPRRSGTSGSHIIRRMTNIVWEQAGEFEDINYEKAEGIAKITINRPEVRNAFRPLTVMEMQRALEDAREDNETGVIILTGEGPDAFCSGGDQKVRGDAGYLEDPDDPRRTPGGASVGRFHVTDLHVQIRRCPKPVVAMVAGYAVGGGHVLHVVCDLTIAADNAKFGQVGPKVGSFDGGFGASVLSSLVGPKKAKEIWFLCRMYSAEEALRMGLVNTVVPLDRLEEETVSWCREMLQRSPFALRLLKASFHAHEDGFAGIQQLAHDTNLLFYGSEEAQEGRDAYKEKRKPDFSGFPRRP